MRIIQPNSWSCVACVAAMATKTNLEDVIKFIGHDGSEVDEGSWHPDKRRGFSMQEILRYMISLDFYMGVFCSFPEPCSLKEKPISIQIGVDVKTPAMGVFNSSEDKLPAWSHTVYWNGEHIIDPSPSSKELCSLDEFMFTEWFPIIRFENNLTK